MNQMPPMPPKAQQPVAQNNPQMIFKIILLVILGITALVGLLGFIGAFQIFSGSAIAAISILFSWGLATAISVISIIRIATTFNSEDNSVAVLPLCFFTVAFFFNIILLIILGRWCAWATSYSALTLVLFMGGIAMSLLTAVKLNKLGDVNSYTGLFKKLGVLEYVLLGAYAFFTLLIAILAKM